LTIEYNLQEITRDIKVCTDLKMLKVKVPIIFSGTQGFPLRRDGRYESSFSVSFSAASRRKVCKRKEGGVKAGEKDCHNVHCAVIIAMRGISK